MGVNKHGLPRHIPEGVKRAVRSRCGFRCIMCVCAIAEYHHFAPEYRDALEHKAEGITFVCPTCHKRAGAGIIGQERLEQANTYPKCKQQNFTKDFFYPGISMVPVRMGTSKAHSGSVILFEDELILGFRSPVNVGEPLDFTARLSDKRGNEMLRIEGNEWQAGSEKYDIVVEGSRLTIWEKPGEIILEMNLSSESEVAITRLKMHYRGFSIYADDSSFTLVRPGGGAFRHVGTIFADIGIHLKQTGSALVGVNLNGGGAAVALGPV